MIYLSKLRVQSKCKQIPMSAHSKMARAGAMLRSHNWWRASRLVGWTLTLREKPKILKKKSLEVRMVCMYITSYRCLSWCSCCCYLHVYLIVITFLYAFDFTVGRKWFGGLERGAYSTSHSMRHFALGFCTVIVFFSLSFDICISVSRYVFTFISGRNTQHAYLCHPRACAYIKVQTYVHAWWYSCACNK